MEESKTRNDGIVYLRSLATVFIVACHLVNMSGITIVRYSGHFFDVGVQLFLIISGFLYGQREINSPYLTWLWQRMKKLFVPMYILLLSVVIGNLIIGQSIQLKQVLSYVFNIQGLTDWYIKGVEHLWYLSVAMICYMLTPLIQDFKDLIAKRLILIGGGLFLLQVLIAYLWSERYAGYLILVFLYITAYVIGNSWYKISINRKVFWYSLTVIGFAVTVRLVGVMVCDESVLYNVFIAGYTHVVLAFGIFFLVAYIYRQIKDRQVPMIVKWIDRYSYEIYLVHFMYYKGPFFLGITDMVIVNWVLIIGASIISAIFLKSICGWIFKIINYIDNKCAE